LYGPLAPKILPAASKTGGLTYLPNVCAFGPLQGIWYLTEPDGPFFPLESTGIAAFHVEWVEAPVVVRAGAS